MRKKEGRAVKKFNVMYRSAVFVSFVAASLLLTLISGVTAEAAPSSLGTVKEIRSGKLERQDQGVWKAAAAGDRIFARDTVRTDTSGMAVLSLNGIGNFLIGPNTEYAVGEDPVNFKTVLHRGFVWFKSVFAKGARMEISTANAVAGTRGTKFSVLSDSEGSDVCTCNGSVAVATTTGKMMTVESGMYGSVQKDGSVSTPEKGKPKVEMLWQAKTGRNAACLQCHKKGQKPLDL
jgi:hypothetical protein